MTTRGWMGGVALVGCFVVACNGNDGGSSSSVADEGSGPSAATSAADESGTASTLESSTSISGTTLDTMNADEAANAGDDNGPGCDGPVVFTPDTLPSGTVGEPYEQAIESNAPPAVEVLVTSPPIPGLDAVVSGSTVTLTGTPTLEGVYSVEVGTLTDDGGGCGDAWYDLVIEASAATESGSSSSG